MANQQRLFSPGYWGAESALPLLVKLPWVLAGKGCALSKKTGKQRTTPVAIL
jgi:hypothetical protein